MTWIIKKNILYIIDEVAIVSVVTNMLPASEKDWSIWK